MTCSICGGEYEEKLVTRTYRRGGKVIVVDDVPAEVCSRCGDTLLKPETVELIQELLADVTNASEFAPVVHFPSKVA